MTAPRLTRDDVERAWQLKHREILAELLQGRPTYRVPVKPRPAPAWRPEMGGVVPDDSLTVLFVTFRLDRRLSDLRTYVVCDDLPERVVLGPAA